MCPTGCPSTGRRTPRTPADENTGSCRFPYSCQSARALTTRRWISRRAALHSRGNTLASRKASFTNRSAPTGSMVFSIPSGNTKWVPWSYTAASTVQAWGRSARRRSMRRMYFSVSHSTSSAAPISSRWPWMFSTRMVSASVMGWAASESSNSFRDASIAPACLVSWAMTCQYWGWG